MQKIKKLPSPYYRVTTRAIILDERSRLLIIEDEDGTYELPGGGWEHDESFDACIRREVAEELGVEVLWVGRLWFCYRGKRRGYPWHLRMCAPVLVKTTEFAMGMGMRRAYFVTRDVLQNLPLAPDEEPIKEYLDEIWPPVEKSTVKE